MHSIASEEVVSVRRHTAPTVLCGVCRAGSRAWFGGRLCPGMRPPPPPSGSPETAPIPSPTAHALAWGQGGGGQGGGRAGGGRRLRPCGLLALLSLPRSSSGRWHRDSAELLLAPQPPPPRQPRSPPPPTLRGLGPRSGYRGGLCRCEGDLTAATAEMGRLRGRTGAQ